MSNTSRKHQVGEITRGVVLPPPEPVEAQPMTRLVLDTFQAEYTRKGEDVIYHLFRKMHSAWPVGFEHVVWDVFLDHFRLKGREQQLTVEWVPELFSWCIRVEAIARHVSPDDAFLETPLHLVDQQVEAAA